jgi:hypothetical protein
VHSGRPRASGPCAFRLPETPLPCSSIGGRATSPVLSEAVPSCVRHSELFVTVEYAYFPDEFRFPCDEVGNVSTTLHVFTVCEFHITCPTIRDHWSVWQRNCLWGRMQARHTRSVRSGRSNFIFSLSIKVRPCPKNRTFKYRKHSTVRINWGRSSGVSDNPS